MAKPKSERPKNDEARKERIESEIVVDANNEEERAMGWFNYLDEKLKVPFLAKCVEKRAISPLEVGEEIEVIEMGPENECAREMFVTIRWNDRELAVPLAQLAVVKANEPTSEAVGDWHYWVRVGYNF
jgi:hypothetical protein